MTQFDMHTTQSTTLTEKSKKFAVSTAAVYTDTTDRQQRGLLCSILSGALNTYNSTLSSYAFALSCVLNFPRYIPTLHMCNAAMDLKTLLFLGQSVVVQIQLQCVIKIL